MKILTIDYAAFESIRSAFRRNGESRAEEIAEAEKEHNDCQWLWLRGAQCISEQALGWLNLIEELGTVKEEE